MARTCLKTNSLTENSPYSFSQPGPACLPGGVLSGNIRANIDLLPERGKAGAGGGLIRFGTPSKNLTKG